jgi:hypothetical protein
MVRHMASRLRNFGWIQYSVKNPLHFWRLLWSVTSMGQVLVCELHFRWIWVANEHVCSDAYDGWTVLAETCWTAVLLLIRRWLTYCSADSCVCWFWADFTEETSRLNYMWPEPSNCESGDMVSWQTTSDFADMQNWSTENFSLSFSLPFGWRAVMDHIRS